LHFGLEPQDAVLLGFERSLEFDIVFSITDRSGDRHFVKRYVLVRFRLLRIG
jgi:hypothetical protein